MICTRICTAALAASLFFCVGAQAHGEAHSTHGTMDYSKVEQTPFGSAADPAKAARTVHIDMVDALRFTPSEVRVRRGDTVRFVVANKGKLKHEMVLGTMDDLKKHAELMKRFPNMEHDDPNMAHISPGKTGEMGWRFNRAGTFYYGCLEPGHFEAGMIGKVIVE